MTEHGGQLGQASRHYGIPVADWLDVSTGISPWVWPVPALPESVWSRLPEADDGLLETAADYYGCAPELLTAVPGSQFAIRQLPQAVPPGSVLVPAVGYTEHARCWREAGHRLVWYRDLDELVRLVGQADHAVVINPDNPTARVCSADWLLALRREMAPGGLLIVDEAFMDVDAESVLPRLPVPGILALRSLGKFFGLAGLRLGFLAGDAPALATVQQQVQPWGVSHPARWVGHRALADGVWQAEQRARIASGSAQLTALLQRVFGATRVHSAGLFSTVFFDDETSAPTVHDKLGRQGVLVRLGDNRRWLRFGLPAAGEPRLAQALDNMPVG